MEERRMGESQPVRRLTRGFVAVAYKGHMYRNFVIGHMSDLKASRARTPTRVQEVLRGEEPDRGRCRGRRSGGRVADAREVAGEDPGRREAGAGHHEEPPQRAEKRLLMEDPSQPCCWSATSPRHHRPGQERVRGFVGHPCRGAVSRLYKALVKEKQVALPSRRSVVRREVPSLFSFLVMANRGRTNASARRRSTPRSSA